MSHNNRHGKTRKLRVSRILLRLLSRIQACLIVRWAKKEVAVSFSIPFRSVLISWAARAVLTWSAHGESDTERNVVREIS